MKISRKIVTVMVLCLSAPCLVGGQALADSEREDAIQANAFQHHLVAEYRKLSKLITLGVRRESTLGVTHPAWVFDWGNGVIHPSLALTGAERDLVNSRSNKIAERLFEGVFRDDANGTATGTPLLFYFIQGIINQGGEESTWAMFAPVAGTPTTNADGSSTFTYSMIRTGLSRVDGNVHSVSVGEAENEGPGAGSLTPVPGNGPTVTPFATMVEYAIMVALIAIVSIAQIRAVGESVQRSFDAVQAAMVQTTVPGTPCIDCTLPP